jgi:hypothetical protein
MPNPATNRKQGLRKTKAQLIDEIDTLEQRAAATLEDAICQLKGLAYLYARFCKRTLTDR